jgi:hypothetical protein
MKVDCRDSTVNFRQQYKKNCSLVLIIDVRLMTNGRRNNYTHSH